MVLGTRNFNEEHVPFKSGFGNKVTSVVFRLLYGKQLCDTQTGLRGITGNYLEELCELTGERYEYEIRMLILAAKKNMDIHEIAIETIYMDDNKETHFHPIKDSIRIYRVMFSTFFKYLLSSLSTSIMDIGLFALFNIILLVNLPTDVNVWISTIVARVISSVCNYLINRKIVFESEDNAVKTMLQYSGLVVVQMVASAGLVYLFTVLLSWSAVVVKIIVDSCLFLVSFQVQQRLIFKK